MKTLSYPHKTINASSHIFMAMFLESYVKESFCSERGGTSTKFTASNKLRKLSNIR